MGRFKKYVKKQAKRAYGYAKKRYAPAGKIDISRIAKDVAMVKSVLNVERKITDRTDQTFSIPVAGSNWQLWRFHTTALGNRDYERTGSSLRLKSLQLRGRIELPDLAQYNGTRPASRVRIVIFMDREVNNSNTGVLPVATDLYVNNNVDSMRNWDSVKSKRFVVLKTMFFNLDTDNPQKLINFYKKVSIPVKYAASDTDGTNIIQHPVYIGFSSDVDGVSQTNINALFSTRVTFVDN